MNTLNLLSIDLITRAVTGDLPDLEKIGDDLLVSVNFTNAGSVMNLADSPQPGSITAMLLTLKSTDSGEIVLQSDSWSGSGSTYYLHAALSGSPLSGLLGSNRSTNLLGEIEWVQINPLNGSANGNIGPSTLRTSSQNFSLIVGQHLS
jgi:hypothetical protein